MFASRADTILAVSSPPGSSSTAVLRLSGRGAFPILEEIAGEGRESLSRAPGASGLRIALAVAGARVEAWSQVYRAPLSYTREDLIEIFVPGSPPLLRLVSKAILGSREGRAWRIRWAQAGEFTLRAFLNGRIDLAQAEAVAALISSGGEEEARAARRGLSGELGARFRRLAELVLELLAHLEACLDFPDEDIPELTSEAVGQKLSDLSKSLGELRGSTALRMPSTDTLRVVLAGFPNAGKSSLLNALLGRRAAITSDIPGTTRDPVRGTTLHGGRRVEWIDLAGTSRAEDLVEEPKSASSHTGSYPHFEPQVELPGGPAAAIAAIVRRLSRVEVQSADRVLWVADCASPLDESLGEYERLDVPAKMLVLQKADLLSPEEEERLRSLPARPMLASALRKTGLGEIVRRVLLAEPVERPIAAHGPAQVEFLLSAHQEAALAVVEEALGRARAALNEGLGVEYVAADLREALSALEDLTGKAPREAVLDWVFSRFCVGK